MQPLPLEIFVDILAEDHATALISDAQMVVYAINKIKRFRDGSAATSKLLSDDRSISIFGNYVAIFRQFSPNEIIITLHDPQLSQVPMENIGEMNHPKLEAIMDHIEANYEELKMQVGLVKDI